jgi:hypothetical protein
MYNKGGTYFKLLTYNPCKLQVLITYAFYKNLNMTALSRILLNSNFMNTNNKFFKIHTSHCGLLWHDRFFN